MEQQQIPFGSFDLVDEDLVNAILWRLSELWDSVKLITHQILEYTGTYTNIDAFIHILSRYPYFSFWAFGYSICVVLPLIIIVTLVLSTILLTLSGFIVFEGAIISIVSVLLFGCIGALILVLGFFGLLIIAGVFGFMYIYDFWDSAHEKRALNNYINEEKNKSFQSFTSEIKIAVIEASISNADQDAVIEGSVSKVI